MLDVFKDIQSTSFFYLFIFLLQNFSNENFKRENFLVIRITHWDHIISMTNMFFLYLKIYFRWNTKKKKKLLKQKTEKKIKNCITKDLCLRLFKNCTFKWKLWNQSDLWNILLHKNKKFCTFFRVYPTQYTKVQNTNKKKIIKLIALTFLEDFICCVVFFSYKLFEI